MPDFQTRLSLIKRVRNTDDTNSWAEFVNIYTPVIFGFLRKRGISPVDSEDVTQEVFRALAKALPEFQLDKSIGTFRNWLFTVTRSKLNNHLNKSKRTDIPTDQLIEEADTRDWDQFYFKELFSHACQQVEKEIDPSSWEAFWRTAVNMEPIESVAQDLALSTANTYQKKSRVAARIRNAIREIDESVI